jgi:hypothetical protein
MNNVCASCTVFNGQVYICQLGVGHENVHEDGDNFWEVISHRPPVEEPSTTRPQETP